MSTSATKSAADAPTAQTGTPPPVRWKLVWPLPTLVIGVGLLVGGMWIAVTSRPKPDPSRPLARAMSLVETREFEEAIELLNTDVKRFIDAGEAGGVTDAHLRDYHLTVARSFSGAQELLGFNRRENHDIVIEAYKASRLFGAQLTEGDISRLVDSYLATDRIDDALAAVKSLDEVVNPDAGHTAGGPAHGSQPHAAVAVRGDGPGAPPGDVHGTSHSDSHGHGATDHAPAGDGTHAAHGEHGGAPAAAIAVSNQTKIRLIKKIVEHNLRSTSPRDELTLELLNDLMALPELPPSDRAWVTARQAELLLSAGRAEDAIVKLLPRIRMGEHAGPSVNAELHALLGRAYFDAGQFDAAMKQLEVAAETLGPLDPARAPVEVMIGRILQSVGDLSGARGRFEQVVTEHGTTESYLPAMLGLAEVEGAVIGTDAPEDAAADLERSIRRYAEIVDAVKTRSLPPRLGVTRPRVTASLLDRAMDRENANDLANALRYAQLAESLYGDGEAPPEVHSALARTHRRSAERLLSEARERVGPNFSMGALNPVERTEIKTHFLSAAEHAKAFAALVSATDQGGYADALWLAADSYDLAGDLESAKRGFSAYADGAADADPRRPEAKFRLAQTFMALGDFPSAAAILRGLRDGSSSPGGSGGAGAWADLAVAPLAKCLISDGTPDNDEEAEILLRSVVDGSVVSPESPTFRNALMELGRMYYASGRYAEAVGRLTELVQRYPDEPASGHWRFWLADSLRLSAEAITHDLEQSIPQSERASLSEARADRLREAMAGYRQVRATLEAQPDSLWSELDRLYVRNAYFYEGDCAFDLGDFDAAVRAYDAARQRYADDPASLVAMVQIVNAYIAQERWAEARTANERATHHLERFPESVWTRHDLPMERRHWERWLDARTLLDQRDNESSAQATEGQQ